ncbi:hypothetical protein Gpo141_00012704 [Globisporangium polare]
MNSTATAKFTSPFPPLELTGADEARLEDMAYFLVQSTVLEYQEYLYKDERVVDHDQWKFMKRKQKVRVYVERSEKEKRKRRRKQEEKGESSSSSCCLASEVESFSPESTWSSVADARAPGTTGTAENSQRKGRSSLGLPTFLVAGSIEGTLEDAMYGVLSPTVDAMRIKSSYVCDKIVNAAVLATIIAPTVENPFQSLSIKWIEKRQPMHLDALVKNHDIVILESTGTTCLTNGERIGYVLLHSVQFPETLPLDSVIRGGLSICMLFREDTKASVDVFLIGNVGPAQGATRLLVVKSAIEGLISVWKLVECARMKKLAWALSQQHSCSIDRIPVGEDEEEPSRLSEGGARLNCTHCKRRAASRSRWQRYFSTRRTTTATCTLCSEYVCSSCKVKQKLSYLAPDPERRGCRQREFTFCALCIHVAVMRTNSLAVATEEAHAMARNSAGHKSLITAWLRGMLDQPLFRYTRTRG